MTHTLFLQAAATADHAETKEALLHSVEAAFEALGFPIFGAYEGLRGSESTILRGLCVHPAPAWHEYYLAHRLFKWDPRARPAIKGVEPYLCGDVAECLGVTENERRTLETIRAFGVAETLVLPLHTPERRIFAAVLSGPDADVCRKHKVPALMLACVFLYRAIHLTTRGAAAPTVKLRDRQTECLELARRGKTSIEIASIVNLSPRTVDDHLRAACAALGVRTRAQAVLKALELGLLPMSL